MNVSHYDSAGTVREITQQYLSSDPVRNNLVLTILDGRVADSEPGEYWVASHDGQVIGVGLHSPPPRPLVLSAMTADVAAELAEWIVTASLDLPGVVGDAQLAARFAGKWAERRKVAAIPTRVRRLYEATAVLDRNASGGTLVVAGAEHAKLALNWIKEFLAEIDEPTFYPSELVDSSLAKGLLWLWSDGGFRCIAMASPSVIGTSRVRAVYTPPEHRRKGYAEALVRTVTRRLLEARVRPVLFADLADPVANSVYRRVGYEPVTDFVHYRLGD